MIESPGLKLKGEVKARETQTKSLYKSVQESVQNPSIGVVIFKSESKWWTTQLTHQPIAIANPRVTPLVWQKI